MLKIKTKKMSNGSFILSPIDICVPEGTKLILFGKNGAGKSMFLKTLVQPNRDVFETYTINGEEIKQGDVSYVGRLNLVPDIKIRKIKHEMALRVKRWNQEVYQTLMNNFEIPQEGTVKTLSLGNQQKLAIAIALSHQPKVLLMDEVFEGIDDLSKVEILRIIKDYITESNAILILVTHKVAGLGEDFDHVIHMENGSIILSEDIERFKSIVNNRVDYPTAQNLENLLSIYKESIRKEGVK